MEQTLQERERERERALAAIKEEVQACQKDLADINAKFTSSLIVLQRIRAKIRDLENQVDILKQGLLPEERSGNDREVS